MGDTARSIALDVLGEIERRGCFAGDALERRLGRAPRLAPRDRALARELVLGTLRWRGRIDHVLGGFLARPLEALPPPVRNALRVGAYQILFLDRIPDHAAVSEAVDLARALGRPGHARLVNAVLRNLIRRGGDQLLPDPADTVPYLSVTRSFPQWMVRRWVGRLGREEAERLMDALNLRPALAVRVNTLRVSVEDYIENLRATGREARRHPLAPEVVEIPGRGDPEALPGFSHGWFYVQDPGAALVARLLGARPGERILDACAAPGGKTTHIAQLMRDRGAVTALESDPARLKLLEENLARLGVTCVTPCPGDAAAAHFETRFDRILIDAPCSGLGTLGRHPEAKWQKGEEDLARHRERQLRLLRHLSGFLEPGGRLVYAVCSLEPEEGEEVAEAFLRERPEFVLERRPPHVGPEVQALFDDRGFFRAWPHRHRTDGFFAASFVRRSVFDPCQDNLSSKTGEKNAPCGGAGDRQRGTAALALRRYSRAARAALAPSPEAMMMRFP